VNKFILSCFVLVVVSSSYAQDRMLSLFNGKDLKGFDIYIGAKEKGGKPMGLNSDPLKIFSVTHLGDENVLRISGEVNGSIATRKAYKNYHVRMVFKWGEKIYKQLNSGLLYHSFGDFGEGLDVWMSSHEFQLCTGKMGDSYCMGRSFFEIPVFKSEDGKSIAWSPSGQLSQFGDGKPSKNCSKGGDYEKAKGEWNVIDLYCFGRTSVHMVNGHVVMINFKSGKIVKGKVVPLAKGKIQIQSEGGELFVKSLQLERIRKIPEELLNP